jgi:ribose 1,5-bisphosphate isomerase
MDKKERFNRFCKDIKSLKIQGAKNIAKSAYLAYLLSPTNKSKKLLCSLRPTEPLLFHVLNNIDKYSYPDFLHHLDSVQQKINLEVFKLIKKNYTVFTHCHSSTVVDALIYAKNHKKHFKVYNTETRPRFQGRKTAKELKKAKINVTMFVDSAARLALEKQSSLDKEYSDIVFLGADAILDSGVINKIGSALFAEIAYNHKIPVYILADSWKFLPKSLKIEERDFHEVWAKHPPGLKMRNPAFELVPKKYITGIITEFGTLSYPTFLKKITS